MNLTNPLLKNLAERAKLLNKLRLRTKLALLIISLFVAWFFWPKTAHETSVELRWQPMPYFVSSDFLGVAIDAAMLTDGQWWANSDAPPRPLDLTDADLLQWTKLLAPAWLRLGGTEADKLWLLQDGEAHPPAPVLTQSQLTGFINFAERVNAKPFITTSAGPLTRKENQWQPEQFNRLLSWLPQGFNGALEFGNEPGAHWLIFGRQHQIGFDQLAQEFKQAQTLANKNDIDLAGPANAFWPEIGEPLKQVFGSSKDFLQAGGQPDIFTWHYYPTQSNRCGVKTEGADWHSLFDPETFDEFEKRNAIIKQWLQSYSPSSKQWLGETGPAQCGGKAKLTDRFGASLWWLTHLGLAAKGANETIIRQSLVGGDYALLRYHQGYSPNPDFWASVLWRQTMGPKALPIMGGNKRLRAFAHCHAQHSNHLAMVVVNLSDAAVNLDIPQAGEFSFLDVSSHELTSRYAFVEQQLAETLLWQSPTQLPWQPVENWRPLPAYSYRWLNIANVTACGDS